MGAPNAAVAHSASAVRAAPPVRSVQRAVGGAVAALGIAAAVNAIIYLLMIVNRTTLLHNVIASGAVWMSRLAGLAAIAAVVHCALVLTRWLLARRSATFGRLRLPESRTPWALWTGCLVPLINVAWAPVYVVELATLEDRAARLRKPIVVWWVVWAVASAAALFAFVTSWSSDAQGIANNTVATIVADVLGLAAVLTAAKVVEAFEQRSLGKPAHHWVVVGGDGPGGPSAAETGPVAMPSSEMPTVMLQPSGQEPAA